jgi:hypothetical protein
MNKLLPPVLSLLGIIIMAQTVMAQTVAPRPPDPLTQPAAPATTQAQDGVRNGTTRQERDQHAEPGAPNQAPPSPTLPTPGSPPR